MQFPAFLTGSPGRAAYELTRVRGFGEAASTALHGVADGSMTGAQAAAALHDANGALLHGTWGDLLTAAEPGLRRALGSEWMQSSMRMHASLGELMPARSTLAGAATIGGQASAAGSAASLADVLVSTIDGAMPKLEAAARRTAITRLTVGTLGAGGAIAGLHALGDH